MPGPPDDLAPPPDRPFNDLAGNPTMDPKLAKLLPGILFDIAGIAFLVAAVIGRQTTFYALGAAFLALGAVFLTKGISDLRQAGTDDPKAP